MINCWEVSPMVELEHARELLCGMGLGTAADLLVAQMNADVDAARAILVST